MKIIHVTDCMNAGVSTAIIDLVRANPQHDHLLLWRTKSDSPAPSKFELNNFFQMEYRLKSALVPSVLQLRKLTIQLQPDIIHLHSSRAGFIGRVIPSRVKIFYSSHGFGFQRMDVPRVLRYLFWSIEFMMRNRTDSYVAFWPLDFKLANSNIKYKKVLFHKTALLREFPIQNLPSKRIKNKVFITTARLAKAKDPFFLVQALQLMSLKSKPSTKLPTTPRFIWIGLFGSEAKNSKMSAKMRSVGIELVSWKKRDDLKNELSLAEATLITSAWESGPMTFYESLLAGTPVLMRDIESVSMYSFHKYQSPEALKSGILSHILDPKFRQTALDDQIRSVNDYFERTPFSLNIYN
jgi:hypothetical protein